MKSVCCGVDCVYLMASYGMSGREQVSVFGVFLPHSARNAKHGIATLSRPSVHNVEVPLAYRLD